MRYLIIGAGRSGLAAALLAKKLGFEVFVSESSPIDKFETTSKKLKEKGIDAEFGGNTIKALKSADIAVASPGIPPNAPVIKEAEKIGLPIISEIEFAWRQMKNNPIVGVTGTNGKTTTTSLIARILNDSGRKAVAAGNIGSPLASYAGNIDDETIVVVELSSFQLDRIVDFKPDVAVIMNLTPDHIGYHGSFEKYVEAKFRIFENQTKNDLLILNADDKFVLGGINKASSETAFFSLNFVEKGIYIKNDKVFLNYKTRQKEEELMNLTELSLPGTHNAYNSMAAALAARAFEVRNEDIRDSLMSFEGVEHRMEFVRNLDGVEYVNDSKATNVNSAWYALSSYKKPIVWIAGGRGDSNEYSQLFELVQKNVKCVVSIGEESQNIFNSFSSMVRCFQSDALREAVETAKDFAEPGDIVLFAPACKSFDMFLNYEHRGEVFKEIVNNLE